MRGRSSQARFAEGSCAVPWQLQHQASPLLPMRKDVLPSQGWAYTSVEERNALIQVAAMVKQQLLTFPWKDARYWALFALIFILIYFYTTHCVYFTWKHLSQKMIQQWQTEFYLNLYLWTGSIDIVAPEMKEHSFSQWVMNFWNSLPQEIGKAGY